MCECADLGTDLPSGTYTITVNNGDPIDVYCDFDGDEPYTFYKVTNGVQTYNSVTANSCHDVGMDIWIPRSHSHLQRAAAYVESYGGSANSDLQPVGVTRPANGCGTCTGTAMNYDAILAASGLYTDWQALDGGTWFLRSSTYNEPNGDYSSNVWLGGLNYLSSTMASTSMTFNDITNGYSSGTTYMCAPNGNTLHYPLVRLFTLLSSIPPTYVYSLCVAANTMQDCSSKHIHTY